MTSSDLLTKLVLLVFLHFERSYGNVSLLSKFLDLGISKNKLEKAVKYLVAEGYLVRTLVIQPEDGRSKKRISLPREVTDECRLMWLGDANSSEWEGALQQILDSFSGSRHDHLSKTHTLTEKDHFVLITCLMNADKSRFFTDGPAKSLAESIGIDGRQFMRSISKLIELNLIYRITAGMNVSVLFGKLKSIYRIQLRPLAFQTVSFVPDHYLGFRRFPHLLTWLALHKSALTKYKRSQVSKSKRLAKAPRIPNYLAAMAISDNQIQRLTNLISGEVYKALSDIFTYAILVSIRNYVKQCRRLQNRQTDTGQLFKSVNASVSQALSQVLSYEEPRNFELTESIQPQTLSAQEKEFFREFLMSGLIAETVDLGLRFAMQCQLFAKANPSLDFSHCSFIYGSGLVGYEGKTESGKATTVIIKKIDFIVRGIIKRAEDESQLVTDSMCAYGEVYKVAFFKSRVSKVKDAKRLKSKFTKWLEVAKVARDEPK